MLHALLALNLLFLGDSLTEGVPHFNGETDTYAFQAAQQFPGSTYIKLGFRGQTTAFLMGRLGLMLSDAYKPDYRNILVLWAGTNDCAMGPTDCVGPVVRNLEAMAGMAHAAGWKVVAVTLIARGNYFPDSRVQSAFPAQQAEINRQLKAASGFFDAVADPSSQLSDPGSFLFWDRCHLMPSGYAIVAQAVAQAIRSLN